MQLKTNGSYVPIQIRFIRIVTAAILLVTMKAHAHEISAPQTATVVAGAVATFLKSLSPEQRSIAGFPFEDDERFDWHYIPRNRYGLPLKEMSLNQQALALAIMEAGLSQRGYWKSTTIIKLETVLREIETWNRRMRDPEKYYFSFFGSPSEEGTWGWRVEGHHLSLNFTIVKGRFFSTAPRFLGANPARVDTGTLHGVRALAGEEDMARKLVLSLKPEQRQQAVFHERAYGDIVTGSRELVSPLEPVGISTGELDGTQMDLLLRLLDEYISTMPPEIARQRFKAIRESGLDGIHFGWAGSVEPGQPHYYRIQGPSFLIEYDNVQNNANHIHTVWRDFDGDFGRDLLREHYRAAHQ